MRHHVLSACLATWLVAAIASAQALTGPRDLLAALPAETSLTVLQIEGTLRRATGVERWRLYVNDSMVFESGFEAGRTQATVSLGLILRRGDNLISIESFGPQTERPIERWTTHVHRLPTAEARQYAVLVQGQSNGRDVAGQVGRVRQALLSYAIADSNIVIVSNWENATAAISRFARQSSNRDQLFIYYAGAGRLNSRTGEPELLFGGQTSGTAAWPAGNLIRESVDLPSVSVLLDMAYVKESAANAIASFSAQQAPPTSAPWLRTITDANVEIAYTNPAFNSDVRGFTDDFIDALTVAAAPEDCRTFAAAAQGVATRNAQRPQASWPVFHAKTPTPFRFCSPRTASTLTLTSAPSIDASPELRFVDVRLPSTVRTLQVSVDGVAVAQATTRNGQPADTLRVPIGPGRHAVDVVDPGTGTPGLSAVTGNATAATATARWSPDLTSQIQRTVPNVTTEGSVVLGFVTGDQPGSPIRYEVRNNGVVVAHDRIASTATSSRRQIVRRIPLVVGVNNIVVDVTHNDQFASSRVTVTRRQAQPVRALIVGVAAPAGAASLQGTDADVRHVRDFLLRFTDAKLAEIEILTGARATRRAILDAIATQGRRNMAALPNETFIFYFSGYGLSIGEGRNVVRCLVTADFSAAREQDTCLSTTDLDTALDAAGRVMVIADTSYDGNAGPGSRTLRTFSTSDPGWRLTSGTDRPDRLLLVASGTSSAAESSEGGVFTVALETAIVNQLQKPDATMRSDLPLLEAFERARDETSRQTDNRQMPIMKGVLAAPFAFVSRSTESLQQEADGIERAARSDFVSMRRVDSARLAWATDLYDKMLAVTPLDIQARLGRTRVLMLQDDRARAEVMLAETEPLLMPRSRERGQWLLLRAALKMRAGDIQGAIADSEASIALDTEDLISQAQLGMLYAATGNREKALEQLGPIVSKADVNGALLDDEFSRILLHTAVLLKASNQETRASFLLRNFSEPGNTFNILTPLILVQRAFSTVTWSLVPAPGHTSVRTPWPLLVAQYLRDDDKYESAMSEFLKESEAYDPLDAGAFTCVSNFYVGMVRVFHGRPSEARAALQRAVASGRTEYPEYWMAKAQIERMR